MIEVTPNENLVPCTRDAWPIHRPFVDLSQNLSLARRLIHTANMLFLLRADVSYSGYARKVTPQDEEFGSSDNVFYFQIWDGEALYRTVGYRNYGYVGVLHIDAPEGEAEDQIDRDYIGAACKGIESLLNLPTCYERECIAYVENGMVQISFPHLGQ